MTAMDDDIHVQLENGKKIRHKKEHPECVVPDAVPHVREVDIGTRVLARWYNRLDTCYPGTVTAIRRSFFDIIFDDGDKGINELRELRILRKTEGEEGELRQPQKHKFIVYYVKQQYFYLPAWLWLSITSHYRLFCHQCFSLTYCFEDSTSE